MSLSRVFHEGRNRVAIFEDLGYGAWLWTTDPQLWTVAYDVPTDELHLAPVIIMTDGPGE